MARKDRQYIFNRCSMWIRGTDYAVLLNVKVDAAIFRICNGSYPLFPVAKRGLEGLF